ncbi:TonB-dependent receptor [Pedobacter aquae]|uniref:TonB-dependent receptor n=1 Tax=Pedobacter aquae TaxID=2605747 RepID=A0A5C0VIN0_9SPHI|nr:TonB-dependent receptor [Pedobacter aquae]QEK50874.1 TonB-dependent receptor [Pedobacter aquae]
MKLSLQKPLNKRNVIRAACAPLLLALFLPGSGVAAERNAGLSLHMGATSTASRWVNVTGTVKDSKGEPLPGVAVRVKGTNTGTTTDINGVFRLNLPTGNETLIVSFLGFTTKEIPAAGRTNISITMEESSNAMDEIVVTGYGQKKRSEIIGSVATVTGEELMDIPAPNIAGALRNRIAGVGVSEASGRPGAGIRLNVRGSSASSNLFGVTDEPLYIIDGITVAAENFENLDPSMVETITILKDASAAIYGASGAKGVVLVTTKRGKIGKPSITYNGYVGVSDAATSPKMLSAYDHALLLNGDFAVNNAPAANFFTPADLEVLKNSQIKSWYDELWQASTTQRHNLSISGGTEKITFFVGGSYQNENGNYAGTKQDKYSFRSGLTAEIIPGLKADLNFNVDHRIRESQNDLGNETDATFFESIVTVPQWVPISIDGKPVNFNNRNNSPLGIIGSGYADTRRSQGYRINASLSYEPKFLKGFKTRFQISQGGGNSSNRVYRPPFNVYDFTRTGGNNLFYTNQVSATRVVSGGTNSLLEPILGRDNGYQGFITLQYGRTIGKHTLDLTVGGEQTIGYSENLGVRWINQLLPNIGDYWAFDPNLITSRGLNISESSKRSFFGRFNYDIDKKYILEAVARLDASSNFATGNRWGLSPSIGLGWIVSKENFFIDNVPFINFLKLKANFGITGDDRVNARLWQERYGVDVTNGYIYGETNTVGMNPSVLANPDITWEKKSTFNAGIEMSMLNNKIDVGIEVFRNYTYDGFDGGVNEIFPMFVGFESPTVNYREAYSWGSEFTLGYKAKVGKDLSINTSINFGYGNSVVDRTYYNIYQLFENTPPDWRIMFGTDPRRFNSSNIGLISKGMFRTQEEVDAFLSQNPNYTIDGKVPQPGWLYFEDTNGDGRITDRDMVPMFDRTTPAFASGINLSIGYKAFNLSTNIAARFGGKVFYDSRALTAPTTTTNALAFWTDRWTPENPMEGKFPRFDDAASVRRWNSTFWAVDGTTIRVNNMTLSYKVPAKLASKLGLGSARVLATGNNLWTIVNPLPYKDPYTSSAYNYPTLRTISLGLSVNL